jgi:hypothetical protein
MVVLNVIIILLVYVKNKQDFNIDDEFDSI